VQVRLGSGDAAKGEESYYILHPFCRSAQKIERETGIVTKRKAPEGASLSLLFSLLHSRPMLLGIGYDAFVVVPAKLQEPPEFANCSYKE
jgi:hypothetical protein